MQRSLLYLAPVVTFMCVAILTLPSPLRAQSDGAKLFSTNCTLCHAADGSGTSPTGKALKAKDLRSAEVQQVSDADITALITNGKGKMPAFGKKLKPDDVKALVVYIRSLATK
jgi:mono/diheme cytochrome c family protein